MVTAYELEQVRRRIGRLEAELADTRRTLDVLERRMAEGAAKMAPPPDGEAVIAPLAPVAPVASAPVSAPESASVVTPPEPPPEPPVASRPKAVPPPLPRLPEPPRVPLAVMLAERAASAPVKTEPAPLRTWLERLQLWPPSADGEEGAEARLGAWWATRVGTLLAVVGMVFFGVYVSRHTPAWVKFAELLAVAAGVSALGLWLHRRLAAFGEVVFAGGLALGFFAAYAGHAVPAVRVFPELWMSVAAQGLAVAGIVAAALWRRSAMIATLATGLGYVTAIVSGSGGLQGCALGAGALLAVVAVALKRGRGWEGPSVLALPGAYGVFGYGLWLARAGGATELTVATWPFLVAVAALFFLRDRRPASRDPKMAPAEELWFQGANSTLALGCGLWAALGWWRSELEWFYGGAAVLLALGAWRRAWQAGERDPVSAMLQAKAAGALTLAVIEIVGARDAAVALLVQAWVLAWSARRLGSRILAAAAGLVVLVATGFFARHGVDAAPLWSPAAGRAALFTLGVALLASEGGRWLLADRDARRVVEAAGATIAALGLLAALSRWTPPQWEPALAIGFAILFGALAWLRKAAAPGWAAAVLAVAAQLFLWADALKAAPPETLVWNALAVVGTLAVAGAAARSRRVSGAAWALAAAGAVLTLFALWPAERAVLGATALAMVFGAAAAWAPGRRLGWVATLTSGLGAACWFGHGMEGGASLLGLAALAAWALPVWLRASRRADAERRAEPMPETMERLQVLAATVLALRALAEGLSGAQLGAGFAAGALAVFGLALRPGVRPALAASWVFWFACVLAASSSHAERTWWLLAALLAWPPAVIWARVPERWKAEFTGWRRHASAMQAALATLLALVVALEVFSGAASLFVLAAAAGVAATVARPGKVGAAKPAAGALAAALGCTAPARIAAGVAEGWGAGLAAVLVAAATLTLLPLWLASRRGEAGRLAYYAGGGGALAAVFYAMAAQRAELAPYATVGWGLAAIALFMTGLFRRATPYRVLGLLGLALCLPRMFFVDLDSALHRIVAFIVVGVVLMWVGFSYHRFKHLVADHEPRPQPSPKK